LATPTKAPKCHPTIDPADFTPEITNPCFALRPGTTHVYEGVRASRASA
jgi:hypothetical protein